MSAELKLANDRIRQLEKKLSTVNTAFRCLAGVLMQMDHECTLPNAARIKEAVGSVVIAFTQEQP